MMTNTGSQFKYTEEKMLSINSWQEKKKLIAAKKTARGHFHKPLKMSDEDKHKFKQARECHICSRSYKKIIKQSKRPLPHPKKVQGVTSSTLWYQSLLMKG